MVGKFKKYAKKFRNKNFKNGRILQKGQNVNFKNFNKRGEKFKKSK